MHGADKVACSWWHWELICGAYHRGYLVATYWYYLMTCQRFEPCGLKNWVTVPHSTHWIVIGVTFISIIVFLVACSISAAAVAGGGVCGPFVAPGRGESRGGHHHRHQLVVVDSYATLSWISVCMYVCKYVCCIYKYSLWQPIVNVNWQVTLCRLGQHILRSPFNSLCKCSANQCCEQWSVLLCHSNPGRYHLERQQHLYWQWQLPFCCLNLCCCLLGRLG